MSTLPELIKLKQVFDDNHIEDIKNTQELSELYVSKAVYEELKGKAHIETVGSFIPWEDVERL